MAGTEDCDDGNKKNGDGCDSMCQSEGSGTGGAGSGGSSGSKKDHSSSSGGCSFTTARRNDRDGLATLAALLGLALLRRRRRYGALRNSE